MPKIGARMGVGGGEWWVGSGVGVWGGCVDRFSFRHMAKTSVAIMDDYDIFAEYIAAREKQATARRRAVEARAAELAEKARTRAEKAARFQVRLNGLLPGVRPSTRHGKACGNAALW